MSTRKLFEDAIILVNETLDKYRNLREEFYSLAISLEMDGDHIAARSIKALLRSNLEARKAK